MRSSRVESRLEPFDEARRDRGVARDAELAAKLEQVVLHLGQRAADGVGNGRAGQDESDGAVGFVDGAIGVDTQAVFRHALAVAESGRPVVAGTRIDLAESFSHRSVPAVS